MVEPGNEIVALLIAALHANADGEGPDELLGLLAPEPVVEDTLSLPGEVLRFAGEVGVVEWLARLPAGIGFTAGNIRGGEGALLADFTTDRPVKWAGTLALVLDGEGRIRTLRITARQPAPAA